ncbi:hypothetical protein JHK85_000811 [Glycine max]|uniref:Uncharacterized protein n=1 Tax=Glycine soja TaxID=3848 RepID=A0A0B2PI52_GLYSO|nr:hypothetical protein JHK87_000796 [Glycine soja]KAG5068434.1 hypothetical protein JHK85_000811 [Glycine max]KHN07222.1 hypothetical protein glysoja_048742 [Glycine soja]
MGRTLFGLSIPANSERSLSSMTRNMLEEKDRYPTVHKYCGFWTLELIDENRRGQCADQLCKAVVGSILQVDVGRHSEAKVDVSSSFVIEPIPSGNLPPGFDPSTCRSVKFDREADEWIAREHAKEIANNKNFLLQSMDIVGIRDTEIHNYQINLKGNGSSSITRLTPNTKMGQNSGIGTEVCMYSFVSLDLLLADIHTFLQKKIIIVPQSCDSP